MSSALGDPKGDLVHDDPIPSPIYDAIGRMISACQVMDLFIVSAAGTLTRRSTVDMERNKASGCLNLLEKVAADLRPSSREVLVDAIGRAREVISLRHFVVHGHWLSDAERTRFRMLRMNIKQDADVEPVLHRDVSREELLVAWREARDVGGVFQANAGAWADELGIEDGPD